MTYGYSGGYQGLGVYPGAGPPPPRRRGLKVTLVVLAVLLVGGGAALTVVLVNGEGDQPKPVAERTTPSRAGWLTVTNEDAGVSYQVPPSWRVLSEYAQTGIGSLEGGGIAQAYPFRCDGRDLIRATIASARTDDGAAAQAASSAANATAISGYRIDNELPEIGPPITQPLRAGATASTVLVRTAGTSRCYASEAKVTAVAVPGSDGAAIVVLNVPIDGPHAEHSPNAEQIRGILDSITPLERTPK